MRIAHHGKKIEAVLVGCGKISETWLQAIKRIENILLVGLVDLAADKAHTRAREFGLDVEIDSNLAESLRKLKPDVVFDCTTPENRFSVVSTAFENHCHILVEKPLAATIEDARKIVKLTESKEFHCATMQNHRSQKNVRRLEKFVRSGVLGELSYCSSNFFIGAHFTDIRQQMKHVLLLDMAIHTFDLARLILGADPESVYCQEWNPLGSWYRHDASAVAVFEFHSGLVYTYQGSWSSQGLRTSWESHWRLNGTRGSLEWDGSEYFKAEILEETSSGQSTLVEIPVPALQPSKKAIGHEGVIADFIECIRARRIPETECQDNINSLKMVHSCIESAASKKLVRIASHE